MATKKTKKSKSAASKGKRTKAKKVQKTSLVWRICRWLLILGIWGGVFATGTLLWFAKDLPNITKSASFDRRSLTIIKARDGSTLARYGESKGENIEVKKLPPHLINAVLATEDRRFHRHFGIDPIGLARAMTTNLIKRRFVQGGSTITQQLAKNLFLTHQKKLTRKIQEAMLAIWLEQELSKDEILSAYMNRVYLGSGTYGFDAAAKLYFGKPASRVTLHEAAILAGLLKAPSRYSPHNSIEKAKARAQIVINAMLDAGYITKGDLTEGNMKVSLPNHNTVNNQNARYFTDWAIDNIDDLIGRPDMDLIIETTLDPKLQNHTHNTLQKYIDQADELSFVSQGAILSMAPDGSILTMVGGYDYGKSQFNRTTLAKRSPGSAFKPFIYLTAIEKGWDYNDKILDTPIKHGEYRPKNFAEKYYGEVTIEQALSKSMNTATLRLGQGVGISSILKTAKKLGITSSLERDWSLTLGSSGVPLIEMANAYAIIANGGHSVSPYAITKITNGEGRVLYQRKSNAKYPRVFKRKDIKELGKMMENVINNGTGKRARLPFFAAGKTGTSQDSRDAWFAGFSQNMISVVWLGNDDNSPMRNITGGGMPAQIWHDVMLFGHGRQKNNLVSNTPEQTGIKGLLNKLVSSGESKGNNIQNSDFSNLND